jgi:hypothetical protein
VRRPRRGDSESAKDPIWIGVVGELSEVHVRKRKIRNYRLHFRRDRSKRATDLPNQFVEVHEQHRLVPHRLRVRHRDQAEVILAFERYQLLGR